MKKRILAVIAALFVVGATSAFATTGIGVQGGYTVGGSGGAALTFKLSNVPAVFAVDAYLGSNAFSIGGTADWWIANPKIEGTWGFFYGVGAAASISFVSNSYGGFGFGPRAFIGTNVFLVNGFLELYAQVAYQPMFWITSGGFNASLLSFPINGGFRIWF